MQTYLPHLLATIRQAHCEQPLVDCRMEGVEPTHTFSHYCGLTKEQFPPPERLTEA